MNGLDMSKLNIVRGLVVNISDPDKVLKIQVRIPSIHGVTGADNYLEDEMLPWAYSCLPPYMKQVPEVGEFVWIMFENNEIDMPVYLGIVTAKKAINSDKVVHLGDAPNGAKRTILQGNYEAPYRGSNMGTIFESPEGFKFTYDDKNGIDGILKVVKDTMSFEMTSENIKSQVGDNTNIEVKDGNIKSTVKNNSIEMTESLIKAKVGSTTYVEIVDGDVKSKVGNNKIEISRNSITLQFGDSSIVLSDSGISLNIGSSSINMSPSSMSITSPSLGISPH